MDILLYTAKGNRAGMYLKIEQTTGCAYWWVIWGKMMKKLTNFNSKMVGA